MDETRSTWEAVERAREGSSLATLDRTRTILDLVHEAVDVSGATPSHEFIVELALAADTLLWAEDIGQLDADWPLIESVAAAAVEVREMLARRRRWCLDFDRLMAVFRRQLVGGFSKLLASLPDACFDEGDREATFSVPLSSLLEQPADAIESLLLSIYDDDVFRYDLFKKLRERISGNIVVASGFPPDTNPHEVSHHLVIPTAHKSQSATELADLYLRGTPFEDILNLPVPFHVPDHARFEHAHIVGGTGHGKTQLLQRMIHADLVAAQEDGRSVVVIDSQGDLIQKLIRLDVFAPDRTGSLADRLVLIDPSDVEFPPSLNLFDAHADRLDEYRPADRERALNGLIELYETFFGALLGAELTQKQGVIFRYLARLMLAIPGSTIVTLMQLMEDGKPFKGHMQGLGGSARYFFETEFFHPSFGATKKQILKRLWGVLSTPAFERMFAQRENKLDLFEATNAGAIILINTAKDLLKTDGSALFGRFFIAMLAQAALERSVIPEWRRTPTFVYVDEAQEYFDDSIETILTQARKYWVGITAAHQTLDQLSPRLRSAFLTNTSLKCAGGVSARDARALASELHTTTDFIEGMRRRRDHSEFAMWLKNRTPTALRVDVPLGFLERQATLSEEDYDRLIAQNRSRYCGTIADVLSFDVASQPTPAPQPAPEPHPERQPPPSPGLEPEPPAPAPVEPQPSSARPRPEARELGKGGPKHRYLQSLVKELAEQQGFRATIEAPLSGGAGQVDVLLEREGVQAAIEISVTTPVEYERSNVLKCLAAGYEHVALVLAKSASLQGRYRATIIEGLTDEDRARLSFLVPEEIPDYIASLAPPPSPSETTVKGYKVRVSRVAVGADEAKERRDTLASIIARSLKSQPE